MSHSIGIRSQLGLAALVMFMLAPGAAFAQFDNETLKCRRTIATGGPKVSRDVLRAISSCHKDRNAAKVHFATQCNDLGQALDSEDAYRIGIQNTCGDDPPASYLYAYCPAPCDIEEPPITNDSHIGHCLNCLNRHALEGFAETAYGNPAIPFDGELEASAAACHRDITRRSSRLVTSILKNVVKCQGRAEKAGSVTTTACSETDYAELASRPLEKFHAQIGAGDCVGLTYPIAGLDGCGSAASVEALTSCVADAASETAQELASDFLSLPPLATTTTTTTTNTTNTTTTTTSTTSTTLPADPACPGTASVLLYNGTTNQGCTTNADCTTPYTCNDGKCGTVTDLDLGWVGLGHNQDENAGDDLRVFLHCEGPATPGCGTCAVTGMDPASGNCRCANDSRTTCNDPFSPSSDDCGGAACNCYLGAPTPISTGGTPFCVVRRLATDISGTVDVDSGASAVSSDLRVVVHLGSAVTRPCPTCGGVCSNDSGQECDRDAECPGGTCLVDTVAGDGIRGGRCNNGQEPGDTCDVTATNASFPAYPSASGGSGYSLDCMPHPAANIAGPGLKVDLEQTTGTPSLPASLSCGGFAPDFDCPCLVCSGDRTIPCSADADCAAQDSRCSLATGSNPATCDANADCLSVNAGPCNQAIMRCSAASSYICATNADCLNKNLGSCLPSTCSSSGMGASPLPNDCVDLACTDLGGGEGECTTGPDVKYCDGVLRANGSGVYTCNDDDACLPGSIGVAGGTCGVTQRLACFLDPIVASGSAARDFPVAAAAFCMPPTASTAINSVLGLPGPVRSVQQTSLTTYCASNPAVEYTPGTGGCP